MEGLPGWVIGPMPGPPPRQHKHERQYTPSTHSVIPTRLIWNDDYDGQMIFGDLGGLKFPDICLTGEEKPRKTSPRKPVPTWDRTRARCVTSAHATTCSTAVTSAHVNWPISFKFDIYSSLANIPKRIFRFRTTLKIKGSSLKNIKFRFSQKKWLY